jgi:dihydrofolate synthase / folylpolyglutamate synthase
MLFGLPKFGDGIGLHRMLRFIDEAGLDWDDISRRAIVVTGSNGKGSTARFLVAGLEALGLRAGCFTSPHMFSLHERFCIGEREIAPATFERLAARVLAFQESLPDGDRMGSFEFLFLVALLWFDKERPDVVVWEAGIGGRYDPVRVLRARVSLLASVELEHTQILGATEELIAYDKSDALAPGGVLVLSPSIPPGIRTRLESYSRIAGRTLVGAMDGRKLSGFANTPAGSVFALELTPDAPQVSVAISLIGRHQADNAVTALRALELFFDIPPGDLRTRRMLAGFAHARWRGRLEKVADDPDLWIDVGHTPRAVDLASNAFLDLVPPDRTLVIFGVSSGKEIRRIADIAADRFDRFILVQAHKAGAPVSEFAPCFSGRDVTVAPDTGAAAVIARARAAREGLSVLVLGGLFLAAEITHAWRGGDPRDLDFL